MGRGAKVADGRLKMHCGNAAEAKRKERTSMQRAAKSPGHGSDGLGTTMWDEAIRLG